MVIVLSIHDSRSPPNMVEGWWNIIVLVIKFILLGSLVKNCQASNGTSSCNDPFITRLNFKYFVSILNGTNRTLSCEIRSDTSLKGEPLWHRNSLPLSADYSVNSSSCSLSTNKICVLSNLTLMHVVRGHYEGNYTLTAENDCGNASVYVDFDIIGKFKWLTT